MLESLKLSIGQLSIGQLSISTPLGWALTYLAHSTILLGSCWLVTVATRRNADGRPVSLHGEERLWKLALLAGLLTTALQGALAVEPLAGRFEIGRAPADAGSLAAVAEPAPRDVSLLGPAELAGAADAGASAPVTVALAAEAAERPRLDPRAGVETIAGALLALWLIVAAVLLARQVTAAARLARRLRERRPSTRRRATATLERLQRAAGLQRPIALSVSERLQVPIAWGFRRAEICLPARALDELDDDELEAVLAHELAHVARRDALWQLAASMFEILLPFQPLHRTARRRLAGLFELASDDWASRLTGRPLALARSLAKVAGWTLGAERSRSRASELDQPWGASALAATPSTLGERVRRLVAGPLARRRSAAPWLSLLAIAVVATLFTAPAFTGSPATGSPAFTGSGAQPPDDDQDARPGRAFPRPPEDDVPITPRPTVRPVPPTAPVAAAPATAPTPRLPAVPRALPGRALAPRFHATPLPALAHVAPVHPILPAMAPAPPHSLLPALAPAPAPEEPERPVQLELDSQLRQLERELAAMEAELAATVHSSATVERRVSVEARRRAIALRSEQARRAARARADDVERVVARERVVRERAVRQRRDQAERQRFDQRRGQAGRQRFEQSRQRRVERLQERIDRLRERLDELEREHAESRHRLGVEPR